MLPLEDEKGMSLEAKRGTLLNAINLSEFSLFFQGFSQLRSWLVHQVVLLGPSLSAAWLQPIGAMGIDDQPRQGVAGTRVPHPFVGVDKTHPLDRHALPP